MSERGGGTAYQYDVSRYRQPDLQHRHEPERNGTNAVVETTLSQSQTGITW